MRFLPRTSRSQEILNLAGPAIAGLLSQTIVSIVDTAMVGRLENAQVSLAAMGLAVLASWAITSFFSSFSTGTHVLVARRHGESKPIEAGEVLNNSLLVSLIVGVIVGAIGYLFSYDVIGFVAKDSAVGRAGAGYMEYRFLGLPFFLFVVSYRGFFFGIGHTKVFMFSAIIFNVSNIVLDYLFIFGALGFPQMGLAGAGLANAVSSVAGWLFFLVVSLFPGYRRVYKYFSHFKLSREVLAQIVRISIPVSLQNILILIGFLLFVAITGIIGTTAQAASQVVIAALFASFMPCFGLGIAAQTLVGQMLGRGHQKRAQLYGFETAKLGTIFTVIVGCIFVVVPDAVLDVITTNAEVLHAARPVLQIAGVAQVFYGGGIILAHALQAGGATVYVMAVEVLTHWIIFLPLTYLFGITLGWGIQGAWMALPIYIVMYTLMNYLKFRSPGWTRFRI